MNRIRANEIEFAYIEAGNGPLVILLHGFPDTARSWSHQVPALAAAGYRVVAPYLRGYSPTEIPRNGYYDRATLATDIAELIRALGGGKPVHLIGQDWGAIISYAVLAGFPELVRRAVVMAIPHPAQVIKGMLDAKASPPLFPLVVLPVARFAGEGNCRERLRIHRVSLELLERARISRRSAPGRDQGDAQGTRRTRSRSRLLPGHDPRKGDPRLENVRPAMDRTIAVPTHALCGSGDLRAELMTDQAQYFCGEYHYAVVAGAGHFLHREKPAEVTRLILGWLGKP